jgi:20S proteasome alpha/beta subunit
MTTDLLFDQRESSTLVENFQNQNYHQFSCTIIRKVLETKKYHDNEPLIVNALMEVMSNVLERFKQAEADDESIMQLSSALYNLLLQVECVEVD